MDRSHATLAEGRRSSGWRPAFRFPLDVEVALPDGARERVRMAVEGRSASVRVPAPVAPESVRLDPDAWLLHRREGR